MPLGPGLVFRLAVAVRHVAFARVHPDGDELVLLAAPTGRGERPYVAARLPSPRWPVRPGPAAPRGTASSAGRWRPPRAVRWSR
ncbi:hypothetical protein ACFQVA_01965 [Actinomadura keratinilytica]